MAQDARFLPVTLGRRGQRPSETDPNENITTNTYYSTNDLHVSWFRSIWLAK
jgi:hypothetical protein